MKKRILMAFLLLAMLLSGCQLAKEAEGEQQANDRLIGVFVTKEHLDLFDSEAYFSDHANAFVHGGETVMESTEDYNQRIYANMENGGCEFGDLKGILFASYAFDDGITKGYRNAPETRVSDGQVSWDETEGNVTLRMDGTIYVSDRIGFVQYFCNPVRQDSKGRVYLTAGTGLSADVTEGDGMKTWHDLNDEWKTTVNGETKRYRADIRIGVESVALPKEYRILYMDENHQELGMETYAPQAVPEELYPPKAAAYMLVEESGTRKDGTARSVRAIYSRSEDAVLDIFIPTEDFVCVKANTQIIWE